MLAVLKVAQQAAAAIGKSRRGSNDVIVARAVFACGVIVCGVNQAAPALAATRAALQTTAQATSQNAPQTASQTATQTTPPTATQTATQTASPAAPTFAYHPDLRPVRAVSSTMISVDGGLLPVYTSADLNQAHPFIVRAVIVVHGKLRNADSYFATIQHAESLAGDDAANTTLILAPQFLATLDMVPNRVSNKVLRWQDNAWMAGEPAVGPAPVSSYRALDALMTQLADRQRFPNLREIIIAGHSGGAQVAQRYAVASQNGDALAQRGIRVRFLLSSPSTYAYFDAQRPTAPRMKSDNDSGKGKNTNLTARITFAPFDAAACPAFDEWKYGMQHRPAYLAADDPKTLESAYVLRDVTYLVGGNDDSPTQKAMDKSCPAEAQGSNRVIRAESYYAYLRQRHPELHQRFHVVPDVGHNQAKMLTSACALHVMFGKPGCRAE